MPDDFSLEPALGSLFTALKRKLTEEEQVLHDAIMDKAAELEALFARVTTGTALAPAVTALEQAVVWIKKELHING